MDIMGKIDILFIGGSFPMPKAGGSINYVSHLLTGIDDISYVVLTADMEHEKNQEYDNSFGHPVVRSRFLAHVLDQNRGSFVKRNTFLLLSIIEAAWRIITIRPRCVFFTDFSLLCFSFYLARPFTRIKMGIFTYAEEINLIRTLHLQPHLFLLGSFLKHADGIVAVCNYTKEQLCDFVDGLDKKITVIIPPVDVSPKTNIPKTSQGIVKLLTVARLEERKGHLDVLKALKRLLTKYPQVKYTIVGTGPLEQKIKDCILDLELESIVEMKGRVPDEDLEKEYINSDIFVMPHKLLDNGDTEGCPTVFLEAGLHFLPVIGGEAGGVSDAIKEGITGYICHVSTDELYAYLDRLMDNASLRKDMGEAGFLYASNFSTQNQAKKFSDFIHILLQKESNVMLKSGRD